MIDDIDRLIAAWMNHWEVYEETEQFLENPDGIDLSEIDEAPADFRLQFVLGVLTRIAHRPPMNRDSLCSGIRENSDPNPRPRPDFSRSQLRAGAQSGLNRIPHDPDNHFMQVLAAGPLESLLSDHGPTVIDRIESLAKTDASFNLLLGGVWKLSMTDDVWDRVQACRKEVW